MRVSKPAGGRATVAARSLRTTAIGLVAAAMLAGAAGCGESAASNPEPFTSSRQAGNPQPGGGGVKGEITVFAAASLTESFTQIGKDFEADNPGTKVRFSFAGSSTLDIQINQGAPVDVFAPANRTTMKAVTDAGNAEGDPVVFARNQLVIAVPKGNPKGIKTLADMAKPGVKVALCAPEVPCGDSAKKVFDAAGIKLTPATFELDVKATLSKVLLGQVDAALVFRTDAKSAAAKADGIEFPESAKAINEYPIVMLKRSKNKPTAQAFISYVLSNEAKELFAKASFLPAP